MSIKFIQPGTDLQSNYNQVISPLASKADEITKSETDYQAAPQVKLNTFKEDSSRDVQVQCEVTNASATQKMWKAWRGTQHLIKNLTNDYVSPVAWNTRREMTSLALKTAVTNFTARHQELNQAIDAIEMHPQDSPFIKTPLIAPYTELSADLDTLIATLQSAQKTFYYVCMTYNVTQNGEESEVPSNQQVLNAETLAIAERFDDLGTLIVNLRDLKTKVETKIALSQDEPQMEPAPLAKSSSSESEEPLPAPAEAQDMTDSALIFKSVALASKWFLRAVDQSRKDCVPNSHTNLLRQTAIVKGVPQAFKRFAQTLDAKFKSPEALLNFLQVVQENLSQKLAAKGLQINTSRSQSFQSLLTTLCQNTARREAYQALFEALMNDAGTGPRDLVHAPAILSAIMHDRAYFHMFDPSI